VRRYRRLVVIDRVIPFLAAFVGLIALAGAVVTQLNSEARTQALTEQVAAMRTALEAQAPVAEDTAEEETAEGLQALRDRVEQLEANWEAQKQAAAAPTTATPGASVAAGGEQPAAAEIDPSLPTTDCIPLGTRFMVTPNETYPICQSKQQVKVGMITGDSVEVIGAGSIVETGFGNLAGSSCTVMVFSADAAGFAEMRVTCS